MLGKHLNRCEDSLTASVFTHLLHLPAEMFWQTLREACARELPAFPGEPERVDPWPKWGAAGSGNTTYVEPDLFLRFAGLDVIVEAKRLDKGQQNEKQWKDQLVSYANEHGASAGRELLLIAVGGLHTFRKKKITVELSSPGTRSTPAGESVTLGCVVHMCQWAGILAECQRLDTELEREMPPTPQALAHRRILKDLIELFAVHGYQTGRWLREVVGTVPSLSPSTDPHHTHFQKLRSEVALK